VPSPGPAPWSRVGPRGSAPRSPRELARRGALAVLADRDGEDARAEAARISAAGGQAEAATLDVRDATAVDALVAEVFARHARLDYLSNNAGIAVGGEVRCPTQTSSFQSDRRILAGRMSATLST